MVELVDKGAPASGMCRWMIVEKECNVTRDGAPVFLLGRDKIDLHRSCRC